MDDKHATLWSALLGQKKTIKIMISCFLKQKKVHEKKSKNERHTTVGHLSCYAHYSTQNTIFSITTFFGCFGVRLINMT